MSLLILFTEPKRYTLTCDAGAYALTGNAANLYWGHQITAQTGAYTFVGHGISFIYDQLARGFALIGAKIGRGILRWRNGIRIGDRR